MDPKAILKSITDHPIAYNRSFRTITGSTVAAVMLSQLTYWWSRSGSKFYKSNEEISEETGMSLDEIKTAKRHISKLSFVTITLEGLPRKTYYDIDPSDLLLSISNANAADLKNTLTSERYSHQQAGGIPTNKEVAFPLAGEWHSHQQITETTTETTTETKETPNPLKGEVDPFAYLNDCFILHPEYLDTVKKWLTYKKEKRQAYKSLTSIQTMVNRLVKDSNNDPLVAAEMIDTAIANNWAGFFASKDKDTTPKESIHIAYEYALCMAGADNQKDRRWFLKEIMKYPAEFIGVLAWYWRNGEPGEIKRMIVQHLIDEYADKKNYRRNYAKKTPEQHMAYWTEKVEKMRNEQK